MLPALFALVILELGSRFLPRPACTLILLFMLSTIAGMTGAHLQAQLLFVEMESLEFFYWGGLEI
jgi:hypothetical protein